MSHPFSHGEAKPLLKRVATYFDPGNAFISANQNLLFVCAGSMDEDNMRPRFRAFAEENLPRWHIFIAERAWADLVSEDGADTITLARLKNSSVKSRMQLSYFPKAQAHSQNSDTLQKFIK